VAIGLLLVTGCSTTKRNKQAANAQQPQLASTNRFDSSVAAEAQTTARTNAAPTKAPDNTAHNKADAQADTLTPMDQGNSDLDRGITQQLRKAIVMGKSGQRFSFSAKNIKIITVNAEVTLRGVAANDGEKSAIQSLAQQLSGVKKVNNQLDVKQAAR